MLVGVLKMLVSPRVFLGLASAYTVSLGDLSQVHIYRDDSRMEIS